MVNKRKSRPLLWLGALFARVWHIRRVVFIAGFYLLMTAWLFSGGSGIDVRPAEVYSVPDKPLWEKPDSTHWFGTTGHGKDVFYISWVAMATSLAVAVVCSGFGLLLALTFVMLFAFDQGLNRFRLVRLMGRTLFIAPPMLMLIIVAGGSGGSLATVMVALIILIGVQQAPMIASWFEEGEGKFDVVAGYALGLSRRDIILYRDLPKVLRRLVGAFAVMIPWIMLAEMMLSFLGVTGNRISCGAMISHGQHLIIEAPWMAVYPGVLASLVVMVFSFLGWRVASLLRTGEVQRYW
ncbi:hypothetical protein N9Z18_01170 [Verrucomicrobiales bacterium]|jgi:ABC-type dipeptide/oligopeptide/nickel transport system permease subunit|nr:hypothetical protein [Verrucomicrobiales bacterium]